jgi:hypothetical protein
MERGDLITAYSLWEPRADSEFLRRELSVVVQQATEEDIVRSVARNFSEGARTLLYVRRDDKLLSNILRSAPVDSLVLLLYWEGKYKCPPGIVDHSSVHHAYGQYSLDLAPNAHFLGSFFATCGDLFASRKQARWSDIARFCWAVVLGVQVRARLKRWQPRRSKITEIPLGYTSKFCHSFLETQGTPAYAGSLLSRAVAPETRRTVTLSFRGSPGSWQRELGLRMLSGVPGSEFDVIGGSGWLGHSTDGSRDTFYIASLMNSQCVAALPGWGANESFREMEALLCGALPIRLCRALTQTTNPRRWGNEDLGLCFPSYRAAYGWVETASREERVKTIKGWLDLEGRAMVTLRESISGRVQG